MNWLHYVGKPKGFLPPALEYGVSRPCQITIAKAMQFGDRVILLEWRGKHIPPAAFAEMIVNGISFSDGIDVGSELIEQGKAVYSDFGESGLAVNRECGSFTLGGSFSLADGVTLSDVIAIAERKSAEIGIEPKDIRCMIWGKICIVHRVPLTITPPPPFTRGFMRVPDGTRIGDAPTVAETLVNEVRVVENYERKVSELQ